MVAEKERLLGEIDLEALAEDLSRAGKFVRVAYNGVAGDTDLQITVQGIGYDITKLCNKSAITVAKFTRASHSVVLDLQSTYEYLLDDLEEMAVDTLGAVSKIAKDMASAAKELADAFEEEEEKIEATLRETQKKKGDELKFKLENEEHQKRKATAIKASEDAAESEKKAAAACRKAAIEEAEKAGTAASYTVLSYVLFPLAPWSYGRAVT